jgi:RNA polymerase sigma-70 factor (ECF subfamily)
MAESHDADLLLAAGRGDRLAFGALVERHHRAVVQYAYRFLGDVDRDTAEDLAQDVFLKAWRAASTFQPRAAVLTWLLRIATNTCLNYRRGSRLRRFLSLATGTPSEPPSVRTGPADGPAARADQAARVRSAVARLPANQRAAVVLRHYHDLTYSDIAEVLETSVSAVESLLFRARRTLARTLSEERTSEAPQDSPTLRAESC